MLSMVIHWNCDTAGSGTRAYIGREIFFPLWFWSPFLYRTLYLKIHSLARLHTPREVHEKWRRLMLMIVTKSFQMRISRNILLLLERRIQWKRCRSLSRQIWVWMARSAAQRIQRRKIRVVGVKEGRRRLFCIRL